MASADRLIQIFNEAKARPAGPELELFLAETCEDQPGLKDQVLALLGAHEAAGDFLQSPFVSPVVPLTEKPGDVLGRYKLRELLGEGGHGVVYVAEQEEPVRRRVALKVIKVGMDTKSVVARFEAERQALAMMDHPNIAKILDAGATAAGRPYFVMELVRGIRITDYCDQNQLSTRERLDLFTRICLAVQHAHQKGIIHRDLKPSNILVTLHDGVPVPKVIDFGIAKATEGRLTDATVYTQLLQFIGTPAYMSPEQAEMSGLDIDTRSDIYSLGVLLYELLTGKTPFDGQKLMASGLDAMRKTIREQEPVRPSTWLTQELTLADLNPALPASGLAVPAQEEATAEARRRSRLRDQITRVRGDLDWIVMKCLEKDRTRRYESASGLAADIQRHLANEPVTARPPSVAYKFQKAWRRNKLVYTTVLVVAVALVAGLGVSTWQAIEASRARDAEKNQRLAAQTERDKARTAQTKAEQESLRADAEKTTAEHHLYVANMNLARQAWEEGAYGRLRQLLEETRAFPGRGFEWYYWQRQARLNLQTLRGHTDRVMSAAFSPDGRSIVTGSQDQTARVWDTASGRELFKLLGHKSGIMSAAFSPSGQHIVTGSADQTARVWDAASQRELFQLTGHSGGLSCVAFSPDGQHIATASHDQTARVWDAATGKELLKLEGHATAVNSVAFSRDGHRLVTGSADETAKLWDAVTGRELLTIKAHSGNIHSVAFSPDSRRVVTGSFQLIAQVWDAATGTNLLKLTDRGPISSVAFSPDGQQIITGSWISTATVWDAVKGDKLRTIRGYSRAVISAAFSPDGRWIVTAGGDMTVKVWDANGDREPRLLRGNSPDLLAVAISPDGQRIATGGGTFGETAAAAITNQAAQVWEMASGKQLFTLEGHRSGISSLAFSSNGQWIVSGGADQTARLWEAATGKPVRQLEGHQGTIYAVAFSPDSQRILTGGRDQTARVWDTATGRPLTNLVGHTGTVRSVAFSPDGRWIVTGADDFTARVWDAAKGQQVRLLQSTNVMNILSAGFSPDGQTVAAGGWNAAILWELATGRELFALLGHAGPVCAVAFSPDGRRVVTGGYDSNAKLWEAATGRELLTFTGGNDVISCLAFSPDGRRIVTGHVNVNSAEGTARVWEAARADQVAAWEAEERIAEESQVRWKKELADELRKHTNGENRP